MIPFKNLESELCRNYSRRSPAKRYLLRNIPQVKIDFNEAAHKAVIPIYQTDKKQKAPYATYDTAVENVSR